MKNDKSNYLLPIVIIGSLFFLFGFATWLNGFLIPYFKLVCELSTNFQALLVAFAFYISYTFMAIPSSKLLEKTGLKKGMMIGLFIMSAGALVFIPAALTRRFEIFLIGLYVIGTGLAVLQTASNPYVTIMGPTESAAKRISILGICNKVAGALAPIILGYFVLNDGNEVVAHISQLGEEARAAKLDELAIRLINPYLFLAGILFLL